MIENNKDYSQNNETEGKNTEKNQQSQNLIT
jgi:hypothetical protein